jgi:hypothetical protein
MILTHGKTKQEILDEVGKKLFEQGGLSLAQNGRTCEYKNYQGRNCAIGLMVDDIPEKFQGLSVGALIRKRIYLGVNHNFIHNNPHFCMKLQIMHDTAGHSVLRTHRKVGYDIKSWQPLYDLIDSQS